jgi:hypothetical protein
MRYQFRYPFLNSDPDAAAGGDPLAIDPTPETPETATANPLGEAGLKALREEREARKALEKSNKELLTKLSQFDPEAISEQQAELQRLKEAEEERQRKELEAKSNYEALLQLEREKLADRQKSWETKFSEESATAKTYKTMAEELAVDYAIETGFLGANGDSTKLPWVAGSEKLRSMFRFNFETKQVEIKDPSTDSVVEIDGKPATPKEYFEKVVSQQTPDFFLSTNKAKGGGTPPGSGNRVSGGVAAIDTSSTKSMANDLWGRRAKAS